jgi:sec-independent protein translocase protein TatA
MFTHLAFLDISTPELLIILVIILLLFGSKKLPELSRSIGQSVKELRGGMGDNGDKDDKKAKEAKEDGSGKPKA